MLNRSVLFIFLFLCLGASLTAQDIHFSFAENNPLVLNPALAGANYTKEATLNYRNQWSSLGSPFKTTTAGFSSRIASQKRNATNTVAWGVQFINDRVGDPGMLGNAASLVLADHIQLGSESKLGVGLSFGIGQRALRQTEGQWASQYNGVTYDPSAPSGEAFENLDFRFADAGLGILYTYGRRGGTLARSEDLVINTGVSAYHVNRPNSSFIREGDERLPVRYSAFANAEIAIADRDAAVLPGLYYHRQGAFQELLLGASYKLKVISDTRYTGFNKPLAFSLGLFGRWQDAAVAKLRLDWDQYSFGYAYEFNTSRLNPYTNGTGAHEIFLRFIVPDSRPLRSSRY